MSAQEQSAKKAHTQSVDESFWNNVPAHCPLTVRRKKLLRMERWPQEASQSRGEPVGNYYFAATGNPMQARKNLADSLGISANTLRQRVVFSPGKACVHV